MAEQKVRKLNYWTDILEEQVYTVGDVCLEDVENAFVHISEADDRGLFGRCNFYRAYYYLQNGMPGKCLQYLNESIRCMMGTKEEKHVSRCYNMLGVIAHGQNNFLLAAEQYNKALYYARRHNDSFLCNIVGGNLADIYYRIGIYDKAFWWYSESIKEYEKSGIETANGALNYMMILANYGFCLAMSEKLEDAKQVYVKLEEMKNGRYAEQFPVLCAYTFFSVLYYKEERWDIASACLNVAIHSILSAKQIAQNIDNVLNLMELLILIKRYDYLSELLDYLEPLVRAEGNEGLLLHILACQLQYCGDRMPQEQYLERVESFFRIKEKHEQRENITILHMLDMRNTLTEIEQSQQKLQEQNARLRYQAEHDELSGLYNKGRLNRYAEEAFYKTQRERLTLSVVFVDIDNFKQVNDSYGHSGGDACVRAVADCIRRCMPGDFTARYGGDEFLVIAVNRSEEYIRQCGEKIIQNVRKLEIPSEGSDVDSVLTVTVGIAHAVPSATNKIWDFLSAADETLYVQKQEKKGLMRFCGKVSIKV